MSIGLITSTHLKPKPIINKSLYRPDISLNALIEELCTPFRPINLNDIINICVKFFFAHRNPDSVNDTVSLKDIESLYALGLRYIVLQRKGITEIDLRDNSRVSDLQYFINNGYGTSMLGDIAPSVEIFRSIVDELLDPKDFDGKYFGLDLGSGTGWLMLAQYISARRKGFSDIYISGIDNDKSMVQTTASLFSGIAKGKFSAGETLVGDTVTDSTVYDTVLGRTDDRMLSYVSNENIPTCGVRMTGENDPFFQNIFAMDMALSDRITEFTRGFPKKIRIIVNYDKDNQILVEGDFQQRYGLPKLLKMEKQINPKGDLDIDALRILENVSPYGIDLGNGIQKLTKIGKNIESRAGKGGKVFPVKEWRRRWYG